MSLKEAREAIADALTDAGIHAFAYVPESPVTPCAVVQAASPYLTSEGQVFGSYEVRHLVSILAPHGTNEKVTDDLDGLIESAFDVLNVVEVSEPFTVNYNSEKILAVNLTVNGTITI